MFGLVLHHPPLRQQRRLDRHRLDGTNELSCHRRVNAKPAEGNTPARAERIIAAIASIDGLVGASDVDDAQATSAPPASQKAGEKGAAAATRLRAVPTAKGVGGELLLVPLELLPVNVTIVMILQQYLTVLKGTMVAVGLACPAINNLGSVDAFAVGVDTGIEGVGQQRNDIAVSDRCPIEGRHPLAV